PRLFSTILEYPLVIALALLLRPGCRAGLRSSLVALLPALLVLVALGGLASAGLAGATAVRLTLGAGLAALLVFLARRTQRALAAYGRPGDRYTFYELDPAVARIASNPRYFTYLRDSRAAVEVVVGDGRLKLATAPDRAYDLIVLDAFSSDSVPVHLLTRESVELYLRKLRPDGLVAFHVTNRYLDLEPVVAGVARSLGLAGLTQNHHASAAEERAGARSSHWIVVARTRDALGPLVRDRRWRPLENRPGLPVWTDQFSNI